MAGQTARPGIPESAQAPDAVLVLTRQFLAELHPGRGMDPPGQAR